MKIKSELDSKIFDLHNLNFYKGNIVTVLEFEIIRSISDKEIRKVRYDKLLNKRRKLIC